MSDSITRYEELVEEGKIINEIEVDYEEIKNPPENQEG